MTIKLGINGFGRIGRCVFRAIYADKDCNIDVVAINDLMDPFTLAHLLKHDSVHGRFDGTVEAVEDGIIVNGKKIIVTAERDLNNLKWGEFGVDVVLESTGIFREKKYLEVHFARGAKKVVLSAPAKGEGVHTVVLGVNEETLTDDINIVSNASCTTNCLAPVVKVIDENFKVKRGWLTTVHSYTNDQRILDLPHKDLRRARAAAMSMIPTTTGAAKAVGLVLPHLKGKLDGLAVRVPTPNVSLVDVVFDVEKPTTTEEVNKVFKEAAEGKLKGILAYSEEELVSVDYNGCQASSTVDASFTKVIDGTLIKVLSWYDNEMGYSTRVKDLIVYMMKK
ncbi:glyceraldehyde 3-phosphate dehydrogenase [Thermotomaculum hydrothermale]|uniref:Glyceraldehyde-3-phosphate dehydrogenase n=1 Tax=Thermotomaculum hydrothermale TaxID=981385 RepID=A0A7R6SYV6_9BACT|nr:type I glyceraldehyde-3-phosphate dehydrogenase [Thermotomaculum hydrothermale]BBB32986.1 glyceraldehyde 3-phosphate dehydrogenase [Thermotomaculum hydrothermale]